MNAMTNEKIRIIRANGDNDFAEKAFAFFSRKMKEAEEEHPLVILPTGFTPLPLYQKLVQAYVSGEKVLGDFTYLALDEYEGLPQGDYRLFSSWLGREVLDGLEIPQERRIIFDSESASIEQAARHVKAVLSERPVYLAVLGLGNNGHIGFNEPGTDTETEFQRVTLTSETISANAAYWGGMDKVPTHAYTLGLATISKAAETLLLVRGEKKAAILRDVLAGGDIGAVPARYIHAQDNVTIIADDGALSLSKFGFED